MWNTHVFMRNHVLFNILAVHTVLYSIWCWSSLNMHAYIFHIPTCAYWPFKSLYKWRDVRARKAESFYLGETYQAFFAFQIHKLSYLFNSLYLQSRGENPSTNAYGCKWIAGRRTLMDVLNVQAKLLNASTNTYGCRCIAGRRTLMSGTMHKILTTYGCRVTLMMGANSLLVDKRI